MIRFQARRALPQRRNVAITRIAPLELLLSLVRVICYAHVAFGKNIICAPVLIAPPPVRWLGFRAMTKESTTPKAWALRRCRHLYIYIKRSAIGLEGDVPRVPAKRLFLLRAEPKDFYRNL